MSDTSSEPTVWHPASTTLDWLRRLEAVRSAERNRESDTSPLITTTAQDESADFSVTSATPVSGSLSLTVERPSEPPIT